MNRHQRLTAKRRRREERLSKRKYGLRCRFCKVKWWDYDEERLKQWMAHHTVTLCEAAKAKVDNALAEREQALALGKSQLLTEEQAERLSRGELLVDIIDATRAAHGGYSAAQGLPNPVAAEPHREQEDEA